MAEVQFDTLKLARRLEATGFPTQQVGDMAEAIAEALAQLATKADIAALRAELTADIEILKRDITLRLGSAIVFATGVLLTAKYLA
jgi:hypothetical protein